MLVDSDYIYVSPYIMFNSLLHDSDRIAIKVCFEKHII